MLAHVESSRVLKQHPERDISTLLSPLDRHGALFGRPLGRAAAPAYADQSFGVGAVAYFE